MCYMSKRTRIYNTHCQYLCHCRNECHCHGHDIYLWLYRLLSPKLHPFNTYIMEKQEIIDIVLNMHEFEIEYAYNECVDNRIITLSKECSVTYKRSLLLKELFNDYFYTKDKRQILIDIILKNCRSLKIKSILNSKNN